MKPQEEVKASHILVAKEEEAKAVKARLAKGEDFAAVAKETSLDKATEGGSLGYFPRGRMVKAFEDAAFGLEKGEISEPVKSQFGFHVIRLDDRRTQELPKFEEVKDRIMASLLTQKAQEVVAKLRSSAKVEIKDADVKKAMDEAEKRQNEQMQQMQQMQQRQKQPDGAPTPAPVPAP
jgi:peptidyl-prolyl cis-trans isomerase C